MGYTDVDMVITGRRQKGNLGETIAAQFLEKRGYKVLGRNYSKPWGEVDIIAEKDGEVRFIEVKAVSRENATDFSREMDNRPEELVDFRKLRKLARTAALYMEETKDAREYQLDVVGVILFEKERMARCRLFEQVIDEELK